MSINIYIVLPTILISLIAGGGFIAYCFTHFEKIEKCLSYFYRATRFICKTAEYKYIKYDIQSCVNSYVAKIARKIPNLSTTRVQLEWINENTTPEQFLKADKIVMRMHKSINHNRNIVNATFTFVSYSLLRKAKSHIAKYQKDAIDLFVSYKILEESKYEIMDEFVQQYLNAGLEKEKVADFYDKFFDIDKAGLFFPVLITELTFLGEKVFGKRKDDNAIYAEVTQLITFLYNYANRKTSDASATEYNGSHCRFAIRVVGKSKKVDTEGQNVYINNLRKVDSNFETLYILGEERRKQFIDSILNNCLEDIGFRIYNTYNYPSVLKNQEGDEFLTHTWLVVLRNKRISVYHPK